MPRDIRAVLPTRARPLVVAAALTAGVLAHHDASKSFKLAFDVPQLHSLRHNDNSSPLDGQRKGD